MKKRIAAFLLVLCVVLSGFSVAAESVQSLQTEEIAMPNGLSFQSVPETATALAVSQTVYDVMLNAVLNHRSSASVSSFNISTADAQTVYYNFLYNNPETFVVKGGGITQSGGKVASFSFTYYDTAAVASQKLARYYEELDKLLAQVPAGLSDLEKVLFVHDYLAAHYQYDLTYSIYDAYTFLTTGTGVCECYGKTFYAMMKRLGVEVYQASSNKANHFWNVVKIGGSYYHIDVTFDDPVPDRMGQARHNYFLLSTGKMLELESNRADWQVYGEKPTCNSTLYESGYVWSSSVCPLVYLKGTWYAMGGNTVYSVAGDMKTRVPLFTQNRNRWYRYNSTSYWTNYYGSMFAVGGVLYGNTQQGIWFYNPDDGNSGYFEIDAAVQSESIFGSVYAGNGILKLQYCEDASDRSGREVLWNTPLFTDENRSFAGAIVNIQSAILKNDIYNVELLDINDDGAVNILDLVRMKKRAAA